MSRRAPVLAAVVGLVPSVAGADTVLVSDAAGAARCEQVATELALVGLEARQSTERSVRRARRRELQRESVAALVVCDGRRGSIDVYYPTGDPRPALAFSVRVDDDPATSAVYVSERIRAERFVAEEPVSVRYEPASWWLGVGADVLLSHGGVAPLALLGVDIGYRFARHWSFEGFAAVQPYWRSLSGEELGVRVRLDQIGVAVSYHPWVSRRLDLSLGARVSAARLGTRGEADQEGIETRSASTWLAFPAGRLTLRVGLHRRIWLRVRGEVGAIVPRAVVTGPEEELGSLGRFGAQVGLGMEVHLR